MLCDVLEQSKWKLGPPGGVVRIATEVAKPLASLFFRMVAVSITGEHTTGVPGRSGARH